jgi:hypothetical protein
MRTLGLALLTGSLLPLSLAAAWAGPAELQEIRRACDATIGARCDCISQQAASLSDREQAYVAAAFSQDPARLQPIVMAMSQEEITRATEFFQSSALACTRGN